MSSHVDNQEVRYNFGNIAERGSRHQVDILHVIRQRMDQRIICKQNDENDGMSEVDFPRHGLFFS